MRKAFSIVEIVVVASMVAIASAAAIVAVSQIVGAARSRDDAAALQAQLRRLRANALAANEVGYVETKNLGQGRTRVVTATLEPGPAAMCVNPNGRATSLEEVDYDLEVKIPRPLCFEPQAFRLLDADQKKIAPAPVVVDVIGASGGAPDAGSAAPPDAIVVSPAGTFASGNAGAEGLAATINVPPAPSASDPALNAVEPGELVPELPSTPPAPPPPTTPPGQPQIEPLSPPVSLLPVGAACTQDAECATGNCAAGVCENVASSCTSDADCPDVELGCDVPSGNCTKPCNTHLCPSAPHTCGGCQGATSCCTVYGCLCY